MIERYLKTENLHLHFFKHKLLPLRTNYPYEIHK